MQAKVVGRRRALATWSKKCASIDPSGHTLRALASFVASCCRTANPAASRYNPTVCALPYVRIRIKFVSGQARGTSYAKARKVKIPSAAMERACMSPELNAAIRPRYSTAEDNFLREAYPTYGRDFAAILNVGQKQGLLLGQTIQPITVPRPINPRTFGPFE